jgi:hypothetical protein
VSPSAIQSPKVTLALLFGLCFAPLLLAWLLTSQSFGWRPQKLINHGEFILPPRVLRLPDTYDQEGHPAALQGKWSLLSLSPNACNADCRFALTTMRNAQLALGKNVLRVQRTILTEADSATEAYLRDLREAPLPRVLHTEPAAFQKLAVQFSDRASPAAPDPRTLYVVDPAGRLVLRFAPDMRFVELVADLKRLLAASSQG